jgi:hypothetical protein
VERSTLPSEVALAKEKKKKKKNMQISVESKYES